MASTPSTNPSPPGVSGMAVASRAKANTASTSAQPTSASLTPTSRNTTSTTTYSDRWLTNDHSVTATQRCSTRPMVRERNLTVANSQPATGGRPTSLEATRPASNPNRRAWSSLRNNSANTTIAATSPAMPSRAATTRPPVAPPWRAGQGQGQDRQAELDEAVPHPRDQHRGGRPGPGVAPGPQHAVGHGDPDGRPGGHRVGHCRGRLGHDHGPPEAQARGDRHPHERVGAQVPDGQQAEDGQLQPGHGRNRGPHLGRIELLAQEVEDGHHQHQRQNALGKQAGPGAAGGGWGLVDHRDHPLKQAIRTQAWTGWKRRDRSGCLATSLVVYQVTEDGQDTQLHRPWWTSAPWVSCPVRLC